MDINDLIESGKVKITCNKCKKKFKDKDGACPYCSTPWQIGDAISTQKRETAKLEKKGVDITRRVAGQEIREI